jgi:hypothetical protein
MKNRIKDETTLYQPPNSRGLNGAGIYLREILRVLYLPAHPIERDLRRGVVVIFDFTK